MKPRKVIAKISRENPEWDRKHNGNPRYLTAEEPCILHGFSVDGTDGEMQTVAILEDKDGQIHIQSAEWVRFETPTSKEVAQ